MWRALWGLLLIGLVWSAQARGVLVLVPEGETLWKNSRWLQAHLSEGVAGWLLIRTRTAPFQPAEPRLPAAIWSLAAGRRVYAPEGVTSMRDWVDEPLLADALKTFLIADPGYPRDSELATGRGKIGLHWERLVADPSAAFGVLTDEEDLLRAYEAVPKETQLLVVVLGEVGRARRYARFCTPEQASRLERRAWEHTDRLFERLRARLDPERDLFLILVPYPSEPAWRAGERLVPVWLWGKGIGKGMLRDSSTQPPAFGEGSSTLRGFGQGISLLTTLWHFFGRASSGKPGGVWKGDGKQVTLPALIQQKTRWQARAAVRQLGSHFPYLAILLILLNAWLLKAGKKGAAWLPVWGAALTLASLLPATLTFPTPLLALLLAFAGSACLVGWARWLGSPTIGMGVIGGLGTAVLFFDSLTGNRWCQDGLLGSLLLGGSRFYGIGNEYSAMGLGWLLLFLGCWLEIGGLPLVGTVLLGALGLLYGWRAANVGATLMVLGTMLTYGILLGLHWRANQPTPSRGWLRYLVAFSALLLLGAGMGWLVWQFTPHLQAFAQDGASRLETIGRKLWSNWGGLLLSRWGVLLAVSVWGIRRLLRNLSSFRLLQLLEHAWLVAAVLAILFNDSGVAMAASLAFLYWCWTAARDGQEIGAGRSNHKEAAASSAGSK